MKNSSRKRRRAKVKLICFTGMDGAGKTTLARFLAAEMKRKGVKCNYVYGRYKPFLARPALEIGKFLFLHGRNIREYEDYSSAKRDAVRRFSLVSSVYQKYLLFDYSLQLLAKIVLPKRLGRTVVCDRYVYDTVMNDIPREEAEADFCHLRSLIENCFRIAPEPDLVFLIDLPEETAFQRKEDTPSLSYLKERRKVYLEIGKEYKMKRLDGSKDLAELKERVREEVFESKNTKNSSQTMKLLKTIGSPFLPNKPPFVNGTESLELYDLAVKNKISLLYLKALKQQGRLDKLRDKYDEEQERYLKFLEGVEKISRTLDASGIEYVVFKTIRPYAAVPGDVDLLILDDYDAYKKSYEIFHEAGYKDKEGAVVSGSTIPDLIDRDAKIIIDLQWQLELSHLIYMDKDKFRGRVINRKIQSGAEVRVKTPTPELDLGIVIIHSLTEYLYLLGEYYSFLYTLARMNEGEIDEFVAVLKENKITAAAKSFVSITASLHEAAHGVIPEKLEYVLGRLGYEKREAGRVLENEFKMPHRYSASTVAKEILEKMGERRFRRSAGVQMVKMLNPRLIKYLIGEVVERRRREYYLKEI